MQGMYLNQNVQLNVIRQWQRHTYLCLYTQQGLTRIVKGVNRDCTAILVASCEDFQRGTPGLRAG